MNHNELFKHIKGRNLSNVYLLYGPEEYVKAKALDALEAAVLDGADSDFNLSRLDGASSADEIINSLQTLPMLGGRRLVCIEDSAFVSADAKSKSEEKNSLDALEKCIAALGGEAVAVFVNRKPADERKRLVKYIQKNGTAVKFDYLSDAEKKLWIQREFANADITIEGPALNMLIQFAPEDMLNVKHETDKLLAFAGRGGEIKSKDIDALLTRSLEYNVYKIFDNIAVRDAASALTAINGLLRDGESEVAILGAVARNFHLMLHISSMRAGKLPQQDMQSTLGIKPFVASKLAGICTKYTNRQIGHLIDLAYDADIALKSSSTDKTLILETFIIKACAV